MFSNEALYNELSEKVSKHAFQINNGTVGVYECITWVKGHSSIFETLTEMNVVFKTKKSLLEALTAVYAAFGFEDPKGNWSRCMILLAVDETVDVDPTPVLYIISTETATSEQKQAIVTELKCGSTEVEPCILVLSWA